VTTRAGDAVEDLGSLDPHKRPERRVGDVAAGAVFIVEPLLKLGGISFVPISPAPVAPNLVDRRTVQTLTGERVATTKSTGNIAKDKRKVSALIAPRAILAAGRH
jgi:hypothetical protein